MYLNRKPSNKNESEHNYELISDHDGEESIIAALIDICQCIDESDKWEFTVNGFDIKWNSFIYADLCIVLEDLPYLVEWLSCNKTVGGILEFPEQGIQRYIDITRIDETHLSFKCSDYFNPITYPVVETIHILDFILMLRNLVDNFMVAARECTPMRFYNEKMIGEWLDSIKMLRI